MSTTLQIIDGHISLDPATGLLQTVTGNRKCAQDLPECLLQAYDPVQNYGSYLKQIISNASPVAGATELLVRHYVAEAVQLLEAAQAADPAITSDEQIDQILALDTASDDSGTLGFYVSVSTMDGGASVESSILQATSLNQLYEGF